MIVHPKYSRGEIALVAGLIVAVAAFRVLRAAFLPEFQNFAPVMAMAFCGGLFLPGVLAWALPLGALIISDVALAFVFNYPALGTAQVSWVCFALAVGAGRWLARQERAGLGSFVLLLLGNAIVFYLATNTVSWLTDAYPRTVGGLWQALTTGLPGYPPTWVFFRNQLVSDFLFAALILAVHAFAVRTPRMAVQRA